MHRKLGGWEREYEPTTAGVHRAKPEHVLKERPIRFSIGAEDDRVGPLDHRLEIVVATEPPASVVIATPEVVIASSEVVAAEVAIISAVARAGGGEGRHEPAQGGLAAMRAHRVRRRVALQQRGRPLAALLASILVDRHQYDYPT
jgi:hypothetical protein